VDLADRRRRERRRVEAIEQRLGRRAQLGGDDAGDRRALDRPRRGLETCERALGGIELSR
jgi:hypothetical protein